MHAPNQDLHFFKQEGEGWDPINLDFSQRPSGVYSMFNDLRWEIIICFVDIGGVVDHHCLNILFIAAIKRLLFALS